jgi:mannose-6-phosphate isomerase-like protein (cupin superfamily)
MPTLVAQPTRIRAAGTKPKLIDEFIGRVNTRTSGVSVAHMRSPQGWEEPGQTPEFDEFTIVLKGTVHVKHKTGELDVVAGQAVIAHSGEWIQYSTPTKGGAEYIAVCLPAFAIPRHSVLLSEFARSPVNLRSRGTPSSATMMGVKHF